MTNLMRALLAPLERAESLRPQLASLSLDQARELAGYITEAFDKAVSDDRKRAAFSAMRMLAEERGTTYGLAEEWKRLDHG